MRYVFRHIAGFAFGITIFIFLIPYGLYLLSKIDHLVFETGISVSMTVRLILAIPFFITGMVFVVWSNIFLVSIGKGGPAEAFNVSISPRTKKLVVSGPYHYSRNPMVFGALLCYVAVSIFLNSILCLIIILVLIPLAVVFLKFSEEKRLIRDFGDEYIEYRKKVSMIFPFRF